VRPTVRLIELRNAEWACRDAIAAPIADIVLDHHGPELGPDDRAGRTRVQATSMDTMLADIAEHEPGDAIPDRTLDERYVAPGGGSKVDRVVITESCQFESRSRGVAGQLIPLLARHLARFAPNAERGIGEKSVCRVLLGH
jgi:hypothetical protein